MPQPIDDPRNALTLLLACHQELIAPRDPAPTIDVPARQTLEEAGLSEQQISDLFDQADRLIIEHGGDLSSALLSVNDQGRLPLTPAISSLGNGPAPQPAISSLGGRAAPPLDFDSTDHATDDSLPYIRFRKRSDEPFNAGGLGQLYEADDLELGRVVVLKELLPRDESSPVARRRLLFEARVTAHLEHPNIVPVYGQGADSSGRPFYCMRLIRRPRTLDETIAQFHALPRDNAAGRSLALRALLQRLIAICDAMEYAHSRGVVHRDLKPANIMVGPFGETLVADWGLALLSDSRDTREADASPSTADSPIEFSADHTGRSWSVKGSLRFMAPEQATPGAKVGPLADIFALGGLLYQILTGRSRLPLVDRAELLRNVRENRFPTPRSVDPTVPRALEAIALRALATSPSDRYSTVHELRSDLQRWLADEPVSADRESALHRASRWARKHRTLSTAVSLAAVLLAVGSSLALWREQIHAFRLTRERDLSRSNEEDAIRAVDRFGTAVASNESLRDDPALADLRAKLLREPIDFLYRLRTRLQSVGDSRPEALQRLGDVSYDLGRLTSEIGDYDVAISEFREALSAYRHLHRARPEVAEYESGQADMLYALSGLLIDTRRSEEATAALREALEIWRSLARSHPEVRSFQTHQAATLSTLGSLQNDLGHDLEANALITESVGLLRSMMARFPNVPSIQHDLAKALDNLGVMLGDRGQITDSAVALEEAAEILRRLIRDPDATLDMRRDLGNTCNTLGNMLYQAERFGESEAAYLECETHFRSLATDHPSVNAYKLDVAGCLDNQAILYVRLERNSDAEAAHVEARDILARLVEQHPGVLNYRAQLAAVHNNLGVLLLETRRPDDAEHEFQAALALCRSLAQTGDDSPEYHSDIGWTLSNLAAVRLHRSRPDEALPLLREAIDEQQQALAANGERTNYVYLMREHLSHLFRAAHVLGDAGAHEVARREVAAMEASDPDPSEIELRLRSILAGETPENEDARLRLAEHAADSKRYGLAARLWGQALDDDPSVLADPSTPLAFTAACSAALAGCGHGLDPPPPGDPALGELRARALGWLHTQLEAWRPLVEDPSPEVRRKATFALHSWLSNSDLESVRDPARISELPEPERREWSELWSQVSALADLAETGPILLPEPPFLLEPPSSVPSAL